MPVTLLGDRKSVGELADQLADAGVEAEVRRVPTPGVWVVLPARARAGSRRWRQRLAQAETVVAVSEEQREAVERAHTHLIGRVWVWGEELGHLLAARYRPRWEGVGRRVGVIGYNLKFLTRIIDHLRRLPGVEVRVREWPKYAVDDDPTATAEVLAWADTVLAEWCGPNAVLASREKRPGQRLVVRLHRFELERDDWQQVEIDAVDTVVTVGPHYTAKVLDTTGWPANKVTEIPNWVDTAQLARPKLPGATHTLGLLGAVPSRKRLDLALDLVEELHQRDSRFRLRVKSESPWAQQWISEHPQERPYFETQLARAEALAGDGVVVLDPGGPDVAAWLRQVGIILSTSDDESFHLAPAEGMASGAVSVIRAWPGADQVYDPAWVASSVEEMVGACLRAADPTHRPQLVDAAVAEVARYDLPRILGAWEELV